MSNKDLARSLDLIKRGILICRKKEINHPFGIFYGQNPLEFSATLMLLQVSCFLIVSRIIRFILKPLRQPRVVSEILGAIILGPSVLSHSKKFRAYLFPDNGIYVIKNIGVMGFMYFLFSSGVKMDIMLIKKVGRKHWCIALFGILVPLCCTIAVSFIERKSLDKETAKISSIWGISSSLAMTSFPVLYPILKEFNLLSSEVGRMALSTAIIGDVIGEGGVLIFEATKQGDQRPIAVLWYAISMVIFLASMVGVRQAMMWVVRTTPEGQQVDQIYVVVILVGVMIVGFVADITGLAIGNGAFILGLAVPDGPPLGAIIVEKTETIITNFLMPFSFLTIGLLTDWHTLSGHWSNTLPLVYLVLTGYITKMVSTLVISRFFDTTLRDSLTLGLIMSLRGQVELLLFTHWMDYKMLNSPQVTVIVLLTICITAIATPLISILYDPTRPYRVNKRRNIQHTTPNTELHIIVCIHTDESVPGLIKLLEASNPTVNSPFSVYVLGLVELVGRANSTFIDHENENEEIQPDTSYFSSVHNALKMFQETRADCMKMHSYTTIAPKRSMHQDICDLALSKKACLIILPHQNQRLDELNGTVVLERGSQSVNSRVLEHAPCSVGILVDKCPYARLLDRSSACNIIVLFLGGADSREALAYADRMASCTDVSLTVIRFLSHENTGDDEMEKKLDDGLVTWFWVKNEGDERIVYREVVVKNGEETLAAIRAMNDDRYDLWIVGRKQGINPVLLEGLSNWSERNELGVIGDYVSSDDFSNRASVLSVQQQVLRGQETNTSQGPIQITIDCIKSSI